MILGHKSSSIAQRLFRCREHTEIYHRESNVGFQVLTGVTMKSKILGSCNAVSHYICRPLNAGFLLLLFFDPAVESIYSSETSIQDSLSRNEL
jgi:hypothetical protein